MKPAKNRIELAGKTFGRLTAISSIKDDLHRLHYFCICECGKTTTVLAQALRRELTRSCGCLQKEKIRESSLIHGKSRTKIHNLWMAMIGRCKNEKNKAFADYGSRGIKVCDAWMDFEKFYADMGDPPHGMSLDRIDNNLGYFKENCRWATRVVQANNRRSNKFIEFNGKSQTQADWEKEIGLKPGRLYGRLSKGWTIERALTTPDMGMGGDRKSRPN